MSPKYQLVADALRADILEGRYPKTLPTEQALCAQFQVRRQTVRQALSLLESERLIDRKQGSGSHVRQQKEPVPGRRMSIAVVTTYISDYIFPSILPPSGRSLRSRSGQPARQTGSPASH